MSHDRNNPIPLTDGEHVHVTDTNGTVWALSVNSHGGLEVWMPSGGSILVAPCSASNILKLVNWPTFQPLVPPSAESPVRASREHILALLPNGNGMGHEEVEAVQAALDASPAIKSVIEGVIHQTLEVVPSMYGTSAVIRESAKHRGVCDSNCGPVGHVSGCAAKRAAA